MKTLRKINENNFIIYHIQTDLGLIIKVKTDASLSEYQTNNLLQSVSKEMDDKLRQNVEWAKTSRETDSNRNSKESLSPDS